MLILFIIDPEFNRDNAYLYILRYFSDGLGDYGDCKEVKKKLEQIQKDLSKCLGK